MAVFITDSTLEERLIEQRKLCGADRWDEVWEGVYIVTPLPNNEHQRIVGRLIGILEAIVTDSDLGEVFPGVNLSDVEGDWEHNFRGPDVAVFLKTGKAVDCGTHWRGAADFLVEVVSPGDRTREKISFYNRIGVVELLIIDREPLSLEMYQRCDGRLQLAGQSTLENNDVITSSSLPLTFQLIKGEARPQIAVEQISTGNKWVI